MSLKVTLKLNRYSPNKDLEADFNLGSSEIAEGRRMAAESLLLLQWNLARLFVPRRDSPRLLTAHTPACLFSAEAFISPPHLQDKDLYREK